MKKILCMGDVALDVIAQLKEQINYGNDTASRISTHPGGQAANVACWITRTNNKSQLVARVGNDPVGFALVSDLDKYGVELIGAKIPAIKKAEDRLLFKDAMRKIGLDLPQSQPIKWDGQTRENKQAALDAGLDFASWDADRRYRVAVDRSRAPMATEAA